MTSSWSTDLLLISCILWLLLTTKLPAYKTRVMSSSRRCILWNWPITNISAYKTRVMLSSRRMVRMQIESSIAACLGLGHVICSIFEKHFLWQQWTWWWFSDHLFKREMCFKSTLVHDSCVHNACFCDHRLYDCCEPFRSWAYDDMPGHELPILRAPSICDARTCHASICRESHHRLKIKLNIWLCRPSEVVVMCILNKTTSNIFRFHNTDYGVVDGCKAQRALHSFSLRHSVRQCMRYCSSWNCDSSLFTLDS